MFDPCKQNTVALDPESEQALLNLLMQTTTVAAKTAKGNDLVVAGHYQRMLQARQDSINARLGAGRRRPAKR